jgi:hypothetical protein
LGAPLKLDIIKSGQASSSGVLETLKEMGVEEPESSEVLDEIIKNGTNASHKGMKKIWVRFGYL